MIRPEHDIPRNLFVKGFFIKLKVSRLSMLPKDISAFRRGVAETKYADLAAISKHSEYRVTFVFY